MAASGVRRGWSGARVAAVTLGLLGALSGVAGAEEEPGPFAAGRLRVGLGGGTTGTFGKQYWVIGGGAGYYVADGVELGLDLQYLFNSDPNVLEVAPGVRYVAWFVPVLKPYVGAFYRHWFVSGDDFDDADSVGARGGVFYVSPGGRAAIGVGVVYEALLDCSGDACTDIYPELALSFSL